MLPGAVFVLALIPLGGLPAAAYVRGATGDLSITTLVLLWCALLRPWIGRRDGQRNALLMLVAPVAAIFYPMALGLGLFDPYRMGYGTPLFIAALLLAALAAWRLRYSLAALCIALSVLAWSFGWYESANLWDYLFDPFVSLYALGAIAIQAMKRMANWRRNTPERPGQVPG